MPGQRQGADDREGTGQRHRGQPRPHERIATAGIGGDQQHRRLQDAHRFVVEGPGARRPQRRAGPEPEQRGAEDGARRHPARRGQHRQHRYDHDEWRPARHGRGAQRRAPDHGARPEPVAGQQQGGGPRQPEANRRLGTERERHP